MNIKYEVEDPVKAVEYLEELIKEIKDGNQHLKKYQISDGKLYIQKELGAKEEFYVGTYGLEYGRILRLKRQILSLEKIKSLPPLMAADFEEVKFNHGKFWLIKESRLIELVLDGKTL